MLKKILIPVKYIWNHPLTKGNKLFSIFRFIKWQLKASIKPNTNHSVYWFCNLKLSVKKGMHGATGCIYVGLPEFNDMSFLIHLLNKNDYFIDIGSNVGVYSLLASGINQCKSIAIEPIPSTFQSLNKNISINKLEEKITSLNIGLAKNHGELFFTKDDDTMNHVIDEQTTESISVKVDTLDNIFPKNNFDNVLIKIDVEGFEYNVLKGGSESLKNDKILAFIVELNGCGEKFGFKDEMVDEILSNNGFDKYTYDPFNRKLISLKNFNTEENTLYLKKEKLNKIEQKLKSAPAIKIYNHNI